MALLVSLEGIDGSGKGTQAKLLSSRLSENNIANQLISFPRYADTTFGRAIGQFLNGEFGTLSQVSPQLVSLLYAGDRFESKQLIADSSANSEVVIFDRYVPSNIAHQASKGDASQRQELTEWIEQIEYGIYGLPRPDVVILLDLPAHESQKLIAKKSKRDYTEKSADLQEADANYLDGVRQTYLSLCEEDDRWRRINSLENDQLRSIDSIANEIYSIVESALARIPK